MIAVLNRQQPAAYQQRVGMPALAALPVSSGAAAAVALPIVAVPAQPQGAAPAQAPAIPFTPAQIDYELCLARTWGKGLGAQCGRSPVLGEFCMVHGKDDKWKVHGRVDGPVPEAKLREFRKSSGQEQPEAPTRRLRRNKSKLAEGEIILDVDDIEAATCVCGQPFAPDAIFCMNCGEKRPEAAPELRAHGEHAADISAEEEAEEEVLEAEPEEEVELRAADGDDESENARQNIAHYAGEGVKRRRVLRESTNLRERESLEDDEEPLGKPALRPPPPLL